MKRYHGVSPLEQKRSMPAWLARPSFVVGLVIVLLVVLLSLFGGGGGRVGAGGAGGGS